MQKKFLLVIFASFLLPLAAAAKDGDLPTDKNMPYPTEWVQCEGKVDCTVIRGECEYVPVNKDHAKEMEKHITEKFHLDKKEYDCPAYFKEMTKPAAACSFENRCVNVPKK